MLAFQFHSSCIEKKDIEKLLNLTRGKINKKFMRVLQILITAHSRIVVPQGSDH